MLRTLSCAQEPKAKAKGKAEGKVKAKANGKAKTKAQTSPVDEFGDDSDVPTTSRGTYASSAEFVCDEHYCSVDFKLLLSRVPTDFERGRGSNRDTEGPKCL